MKYWVYINGEVAGSYEPKELVRVPGFSKTSLVCPIEGSGSQKNWRHAGLFPDIFKELEIHEESSAPPPPPQASDFALDASEGTSLGLKPDEILKSATNRIFGHVTELMKELENRREERALTQSLERMLAEAKQELQAARERIKTLEEQTALLPGFEDREQKLEEFLERARADVKFRDHRIKELNHEIEDLRGHLEESKSLSAQSRHLLDDNKDQKRLIESLNQQLTEKELTLAKSLSLIKRLEAELGHILPDSLSGISREIPRPYDERPVNPQTVETPKPPETKSRFVPSPRPSLPRIDATADDGKIADPVPMPTEEGVVQMAPLWKVALEMLGKFFRRPSHPE